MKIKLETKVHGVFFKDALLEFKKHNYLEIDAKIFFNRLSILFSSGVKSIELNTEEEIAMYVGFLQSIEMDKDSNEEY